mgnify:FL=1
MDRAADRRAIVTSDMDDWQFPVGTKLWKEFVRDGVRVETRLLQKVGPGPDEWSGVAYVWTEDETDALARPEGVVDARGTPLEQAALGLLHANCGHCHNSRRPAGGSRCFDSAGTSIQLWLPVGASRPQDTPAYRTAIPHFVRPGDPDDSWLIERFSSRGSILGYREQMPLLGTEEVDVEGLNTRRRWVESL